jgi:hypothetical protein
MPARAVGADVDAFHAAAFLALALVRKQRCWALRSRCWFSNLFGIPVGDYFSLYIFDSLGTLKTAFRLGVLGSDFLGSTFANTFN